MSVGIPIKVLHDAEGHVITLETVNGEVFRGKLVEAEDNMNIHMTEIIMTARDGRTSNLQQVYIRGSKIRFLILPDMLKNSPMLKRPLGAKGLGTGRGKNAMIRAGVRGRARPILRGRTGTAGAAAGGRAFGRF
ncbi:Small nuclear ribonucleoprotein D3 polypeptide [Paragonimus heterotremus]|uniref:Small nuclear ribonucleoprotein Sm D3 n=1 Tax=Paragonimus heterotremus TaxID=100268 RepID=A0A8J4SIK4_9TREM|nr:Small nuclear ribonucleoprotein D3 polypeptide [Paragonimus heterotremus]